MEIRHLRHFLALAEHRSFARAAEAANLTQQALSYSIAQLEKDLDVRLFDRGTFGAQLTPIGEAFAQRARLICAELGNATREVAALRGGEQGAVVIGVSPAMVATLVSHGLVRFAAHRPLVAVSLVVDTSHTLYAGLLSGDIDLVVATPMVDIAQYVELVFEPIAPAHTFQSNFLLMRAGHPLLQKEAPQPGEIVRYPWVMPQSLGALPRAVFDWMAARAVPPPKTIIRTDSIWGAKWLLLRGDFVALTGQALAAYEIDAGIMSGFPLPGLTAALPGYFSYRRRFPLSPAAREVLAILRTLANEALNDPAIENASTRP